MAAAGTAATLFEAVVSSTFTPRLTMIDCIKTATALAEPTFYQLCSASSARLLLSIGAWMFLLIQQLRTSST